nr:hypothetical protein [Tanacetum cinerariifolium]
MSKWVKYAPLDITSLPQKAFINLEHLEGLIVQPIDKDDFCAVYVKPTLCIELRAVACRDKAKGYVAICDTKNAHLQISKRPRFLRMDGLDFCPIDQTRIICTYGWYVDAKDRTNGTNDEQYLLHRNEPGAVVNIAFWS